MFVCKMLKFVVVVTALVACVCATTFTPAKIPCAYHMYSDTVGYSDYYMLKDNVTGYIALFSITGDKEFVRCDVKNEDGYCIYITHYADGSCETEWTDSSEYYLNLTLQATFLTASFEYDGEPEPIHCPNNNYTQPGGNNITSEGCKKYTNSEGAYVIADDQNRLVLTIEGWLITYTTDEFDTSVFKTTDCEGNDLGIPEDICDTSYSSTSAPSDSSSNPSGNASAASSFHVSVALLLISAVILVLF